MTHIPSGCWIDIEESYSSISRSKILVWDCVADYGLAQVVYKFIDNWRDLVLKIIRDPNQQDFTFSWGTQLFSDLEFYWNCLDAIKDSSVLLPQEYDVVHLWWKERKLAFIQSYLWDTDSFSEDERWIDLPDLWIISWGQPVWSMRPSIFQEGFYFQQSNKNIFADWDKYLLQLKKISEKKWIQTLDDLQEFKEKITNAL